MRHNTSAKSDTLMTSTYVMVLIVEAAIILLLWVLGRLYS